MIDSIKKFLSEKTVHAPGCKVASTDLYRAYISAGNPFVGRNQFGAILDVLGYERGRAGSGHSYIGNVHLVKRRYVREHDGTLKLCVA